MKILIACEESQAVCKAFREKGHEAYSCDLIECSGGHPEWHIQCDVLDILNPQYFDFDSPEMLLPPIGIIFKTCDGKTHKIYGKWDMIIAFPPCTYMSKAGARWMYRNGKLNNERFYKAMLAKRFFYHILYADCDKIVIENPTPLKIISLPEPTQIIQPYQFDEYYVHPYTKRTCLWIKGVKPLKATTPHSKPQGTWVPSNTSNHSKGYGGSAGFAHNSKTRIKTFVGVAKAMADQWS